MKYVPAKCPNCGGALQVDAEKDAAICEYCKTPFVVEKAINNYNQSIQNQTINNNGTINVENVYIHNADDVDIKNAYDLGFQAINGANYSEAFKYFTKVLEKNSDHGPSILYRGISAAFLSHVAQNGYNLRLLEMDAAFDKVFKDENIYSKLTRKEINSAYYGAYNAINDIAGAAIKLYQPGYRYMDNINMVWGVVEQCFNSLTAIGSYFGIAMPDDRDKEQKDIIVAVTKLASILLAQLLVERTYSVDWGPRSGLGQINKVKHPRYNEIIATKKEIDAKAQQEIPGYTPPQLEKTQSQSGNCYVATCVYGSYDCPQVWALRRYRDYYLDERWWGRAFIKIYYSVSPKIIKLFGKTIWFHRINKYFLDKKIKKLLDKGYKDTKYNDKY